MRRLLGLGLLSAGLAAGAHGQSVPAAPAATLPPRAWALSADFIPLLASGYHLSAERRIGQSGRQTIVFTPQFYRGPVNDLTSARHEGATDRVRGFGLAAQHRLYLGRQPEAPLAGTYLAYGLVYQHFQMQFQSFNWQQEVAPDGLFYYEHRLRDQTEVINRYGATVVVGQQLEMPGSPFFLDFFLGLGLRQAFSRATLPNKQFATTLSDYGHAGAYLPIGCRIGLRL
ncbi:hypothetical protein [Hymenobacter amundsenii]|uniref:hypothetical protein n=1 Tax=Hymenobacter amundsenii TaxID=2006685 RepID=UPI000F848187|nr:hypothetical protein [Hymenobacter amundsenii]